MLADLKDPADVLVADDQVVVAGRRGAVRRLVDLTIGAVQINTQDLDDDAAAVGHESNQRVLLHRGRSKVRAALERYLTNM